LSTGEVHPGLRDGQIGFGFFRGNIVVIALSGAIKSAGGFVGVFLPLYFVQIGGSPLTLGLLTSAAIFIQFFALYLGGFLADYYGRRKALVFAAFYAVFFPLLYAVVQDWRMFGALTVIATFGAVANPAIHATIADSIPPEKRTVGIACVQVFSSLPMIVSPLIGGWLIGNYGLVDGFKLACIYATVLTFVSAITILVFLKETLDPKVGGKPDLVLRDKFLGFNELSHHKLSGSLKALIVSYALVMFANNAVAQYYIFFASKVVGLSAWDWGLVVSLQFLLSSSLKIPGSWLSDRFGKRKTMIISLLITVPTIISFTLSRSFIQVLGAALLLVATGIYYAPAHEALQADLAPRSIRGRITALWDMGNYVSAALGAAVGGFTFQAISPAVPFYVFAVAELTAALLLIKMVKEPETKEP